MTSMPERLLRGIAGGNLSDPDDDATATTIADAALRQFELFGMVRATIDDIARRANVSRVTVYRRFPGKDALIDAVALRELQRFLRDLDNATEGLNDTDEMIVEGFVFTLHAMRSHRLLQRLLESEPETLLPHLTVDGAPFIATARDYLVSKVHYLPGGETRDVEEFRTIAEIVVRLVLSYLLTPQTTVDLDDPAQARAFARRYLRPLLIGDPT